MQKPERIPILKYGDLVRIGSNGCQACSEFGFFKVVGISIRFMAMPCHELLDFLKAGHEPLIATGYGLSDFDFQ